MPSVCLPALPAVTCQLHISYAGCATSSCLQDLGSRDQPNPTQSTLKSALILEMQTTLNPLQPSTLIKSSSRNQPSTRHTLKNLNLGEADNPKPILKPQPSTLIKSSTLNHPSTRHTLKHLDLGQAAVLQHLLRRFDPLHILFDALETLVNLRRCMSVARDRLACQSLWLHVSYIA